MSRQAFSRRHVLRGAGVALALPWMDSLAPREARAQVGAAPYPRFVAISFPGGVVPYWKPTGVGRGTAWQLSPIMAPLAPIKSHVLALSNVSNNGPFGGHTEPPSANYTAALLTCTKPNQNPDVASCATSVDQLVAQRMVGQAPVGSLQLGLSTLDSPTDGLHPACSRSISWSTPTVPLYKTVDPQAVFDQLVGGPPRSLATAARQADDTSVLDYVLGQASSVQKQLGAQDQRVLDQFMSSVRELEVHIQGFPACSLGSRPQDSIGVGNVPAGYNRDVHANIMIDLIVLAFTCNVTRVVSFMMDDPLSLFPYDFLTERQFTAAGSTLGTTAVAGGLRALQEAATSDGWATANYWFVEKLSRLCQKMMAIEDGPGRTMLDNSNVFFGSEMHGQNHDGLDLPLLCVRGAGSRFVTDEHFDFGLLPRRSERLANVFLTMVDVAGALGDGMAAVPELSP